MIITSDLGTDEERLLTNRANYLLKSVLKARYPGLLDDDYSRQVDVWLAARPLQRSEMGASCPSPLPQSYDKLSEQERNQLIYYLCSRFLVDYEANHNTPLDLNLFKIPSLPT